MWWIGCEINSAFDENINSVGISMRGENFDDWMSIEFIEIVDNIIVGDRTETHSCLGFEIDS